MWDFKEEKIRQTAIRKKSKGLEVYTSFGTVSPKLPESSCIFALLPAACHFTTSLPENVIGHSTGSTGLGIVRHFSAVLLHTARQDDLLEPLLWYTDQKAKTLCERNLRICSFGVIIPTWHAISCFVTGGASIITPLGYAPFFAISQICSFIDSTCIFFRSCQKSRINCSKLE